ncbi:phage major capsid protein [Staphylococcus massiliensis]|uniref:phage major capsid protein n=1 Tax=Staphylococcus massiliensis TaxID=555791 RepID=UPI001EDC9CC0|nr:phage major capsid protein [Staphylococcus massiliensis]MCG3401695.1 phage major capsid protein [Staphylococcus massiliensis]
MAIANELEKYDFQNSQELLKEFANANSEDAQQKYEEYMNAYTKDLTNSIKKEMRQENNDNAILNRRGANALTSEEKKFYNALVSEDHVETENGFKDEALLPETVIDRVFEDIEKEHPLLQHINIKRTGLKARAITADPEGQIVWGKIFSEIRGQLDAAFREQDLTLGKATCFVVVPKDLEDAGVTWIDRFVRLQIKEAFAVALEKTALVGEGKGKNQPAGLMKSINRENGAVTDKESEGTLTFKDPQTSIREIADMIAKISVKEIYDKDGKVKESKHVNTTNNIVVALNPTDYVYAQAAFMQLHNGAFVNAVPFNIQFVVSEFVPQGKAVAFDKKRYFMGVGSNVIIREFDQTLALEDCDLYTAKQFAYGEADDENASSVYDLDLSGQGAPTTGTETESNPGTSETEPSL